MMHTKSHYERLLPLRYEDESIDWLLTQHDLAIRKFRERDERIAELERDAEAVLEFVKAFDAWNDVERHTQTNDLYEAMLEAREQVRAK